MEREEHALRRKCEELRLTLENRTRELSQSQELYSKLKQRVLFGQTQEVPPSLVRAQTPLPPAALVDSDQRTSQQQPGRPVPPPTTRVATSNYFPASPGYSATQPVASALATSGMPLSSHRMTTDPYTQGQGNHHRLTEAEIPATPSNSLLSRNPRTYAFTSTPRTGMGTAVTAPGSSRLPRPQGFNGPGGLTDPRPGPTGLRRPVSGMDTDYIGHPLRRMEGP
jgi:hypothetical protein